MYGLLFSDARGSIRPLDFLSAAVFTFARTSNSDRFYSRTDALTERLAARILANSGSPESKRSRRTATSKQEDRRKNFA
jgi:hypothetical protein